MDKQFMDPLGEKIHERYKDHPKCTAILTAAVSLFNKTHQKFEVIRWTIPDGMTKFTMGKNFKMRTFLRGSFDATEGVVYRKAFKKFPKSSRRPNDDPDRDWVTRNYDSADLEFPTIAQRNITMVTIGSYHIRISKRYLTDIRQKEISDFIDENLEDGSIDWDNYDCLMAALPDSVPIHFIDQTDEPEGWDEQLFGPWFARRLLFVGIPSMHSPSKMHKVVIAYIPDSWPLPSGFRNRLGFTQDGLKRIVEFACVGKDCRVGYRLNGSCAHVTAALLLVSVYGKDENSFESTYKPLHLIDVANPKGLSEALYGNMQDSD